MAKTMRFKSSGGVRYLFGVLGLFFILAISACKPAAAPPIPTLTTTPATAPTQAQATKTALPTQTPQATVTLTAVPTAEASATAKPKNIADLKPTIPCVSYYDNGKAQLKFACLEAGKDSWTVSVVDNSVKVGKYTSLAFDTQGNAHISYFDEANQALKYASYNGSGWDLQTIDKDGPTGFYTSLAMDFSDHAWISYYDKKDAAIKITHWTGDKWDIQVLDTVGTPDFDYRLSSSIAMDSKGNPMVAYFNVNEKSLKLGILNNDKWVLGKIDNAKYYFSYINLAVDRKGNYAIAYYDGGLLLLKFAWFRDGKWVATVADNTREAGKFLSFTYTSKGSPRLAYFFEQTDRLVYTYYIDSEARWERISADPELSIGTHTSIAVDGEDRPYISYYDFHNGRLKVAFYDKGLKNWVIDDDGDVGLYTSIKFKME